MAKVGDGADPQRQRIEVDGRSIHAEPLVYWLAHKPAGMLSTRRDPQGRPTVLSLLPAGLPRVFPVGRLDADTEGLVLLTNDGPLAHRLLHPSLGSEREYRVTVRGRMSDASFRELERGLPLDGVAAAPARVGGVRYEGRDRTRFDLVMIEGRKRQIRRTLARLGHPVLALLRIRMGPLRLGTLSAGEARPLSPRELRALRAHAARLEPTPPPDRDGPGPRPGRAAPRR